MPKTTLDGVRPMQTIALPLRRLTLAAVGLLSAVAFTFAAVQPAHAVNMWVKNEDAANDKRWIRCIYDGSGYIDIAPEQTRVLPAGGRKCWVPAYTRVAMRYVGDYDWEPYGDRWSNSTGVWGPTFSWATNISFSVDAASNGLG